MTNPAEALGPAERIIQTALQHIDHIYHGRPGVVVADATSPIGVAWFPVTHRVGDDGVKTVFRLVRRGNRANARELLGVMEENGDVRHGGRVVGTYRKPGLFPEAAAFLYRKVAEVYALDNEFCARWASWAFAQEYRDLKVVLAAFMLVQPRAGEPVREGGQVLFHDDDFRDIGEAMCLLRRRDGRDLNPKLLLRVANVLELPPIAEINRELGFGRSARKPAMGRYDKAVTRWLRHREQNPKMLDGLVRAGFRQTVQRLAQKVGYKPESDAFFRALRWRQKQAMDGRRNIAIGDAVVPAASWAGLGEEEICQRIVKLRPGYKRLVGLLPPEVGLTRAIMAAAIEVGSVSDTDLILLTPTLEDLGLLEIPQLQARWRAATEKAENTRAANIAARVRNKDVRETLQASADKAVKKAVEEVIAGLRVYVMVDISGSMSQSIDDAKGYLAKFLQGFPLAQTHVCVFNTAAREVTIKHPSAAGVEHAFKGFSAGGGTDYGAAVRFMGRHAPAPGEDALFVFVGDQEDRRFKSAVERCGISPVAFGFLMVGPEVNYWDAVVGTAADLGIPCFRINESTFSDPYAIPRTLRALIASTPVTATATARQPQTALVDEILATDLLNKPVWAST